VVADSFSCVRKSVMQDRVKAAGDVSRPLVYGNILHALFQAALMANDFSTVYLNEVIDKLVVEHVESLYVLHEEIPVATKYVRSKSWLIQDWAKTFVALKPKV
jgi:DNA replication ATP-dependent helicase Dna2